jgi:hypothetical protein
MIMSALADADSVNVSGVAWLHNRSAAWIAPRVCASVRSAVKFWKW